MKNLIFKTFLFTIISISAYAQQLSISDHFVNTGGVEPKSLTISIPSSFIQDELESYSLNSSNFNYVEVVLALTNANGAAYFNDTYLNDIYKYGYFYNQYLTSGNYSHSTVIKHDQYYSDQGDYPTNLGVYIKEIIIGYTDNGFTGALSIFFNGDISNYLYWNKNANIDDYIITTSNLQVGKTARLTTSYDITQSDSPMTYYWTVKTKDKNNNTATLISNQSSGTDNFIDVDIPENVNLTDLIVTNKIELDKSPSHYATFTRTKAIKSWNDGLNISLSTAQNGACVGDQVTFNSSLSSTDIPSFVNHTWSVDSYFSIVNSSSTHVTVEVLSVPALGGLGSVQLTYSGVDPVESSVWLGKPNFTIYGDETVPTNFPDAVYIDYYGSTSNIDQNITSWTYTASGAIYIPTYAYNTATSGMYESGYFSGIGFMNANLCNPCGCTSRTFTITIESGSGLPGGYSATPNPADTSITISSEEEKSSSTSMMATRNISTANLVLLELYDYSYTLIRSEEIEESASITWDTSYLQNGIYYLHVTKDGATGKQQIIVQH